VRQVIGALGRHRDEVLALMAKARIEAKPPAGQDKGGPDDYSPETYFSHIHRDYGWQPEVDEIAVSWEHLLRVLPPDFKPGTTFVMGAGTGRLAWQLATQFGSTAPVLALDVNPLPFIVTRLLMAGEAVPLTELTTHPRKSTAVAVTRQLKCPLPSAPHLGLVLADALDPPMQRGECDTVVAPWVVDEVPEDAAVVPELARSLLREGGSFICIGPFLYDNARTKPSRRYSADEFVELVKLAGFELTAATYKPEPYMASPLSSQSRSEHVLYLHARKVSSLRSVRPELPPFLKPGPGASLSIPRPKASPEAPYSPEVVAEVAALIDGDRNLRQIATILLERGVLVKDGAAEAAVRGCLKVIFKQPGAL